MIPIVPRWELLARQEIRRNKFTQNLPSQHDVSHRSTMELLGAQADEMHMISYIFELNLHIAARWLHRTTMTLLRPITKTINKVSHSLLKSEELYWA
ncbi:hypothetical protein QL285_009601 [Trifolium repens]|nr:hypothetical protein QL285_009601 [Trifolium repens]